MRALDRRRTQDLIEPRGHEGDLPLWKVEHNLPSVSCVSLSASRNFTSYLTDRERPHRDTLAIDGDSKVGHFAEDKIGWRQQKRAPLVDSATPFADVIQIKNE